MTLHERISEIHALVFNASTTCEAAELLMIGNRNVPVAERLATQTSGHLAKVLHELSEILDQFGEGGSR